MKKLALPAIAVVLLGLTACSAPSPEQQIAEECLTQLRYAVEQNTPGTIEEWLSYEMDAEIHSVKVEPFDGGEAHTFDGVATLTSEKFPTKTVEFTCFGNYNEGLGGTASIQTVNGQCTKARIEKGYC